MKAPIYVRALSPIEQAGIEAGLRSSNAFTLRRSQILLASRFPNSGYEFAEGKADFELYACSNSGEKVKIYIPIIKKQNA